MRHREHPSPVLLLRFLRGEASRAEERIVVRHLLAGCPACSAALRPAWCSQIIQCPGGMMR
jgi:anti-sigma factor RsiW